MFYAALAFIGYLALLLLTTALSRHEHGVQGYVIGNRRVSALGLVNSLAAGLRDGTGLVFFVTMAAVSGFGIFWIVFGLFTAMIVLAVQAPRLRSEAEQHNYVTLGDMLRHRAGPWLERSASLIVATAAVLYAAGNLHIAGKLTGIVFDLPPVAGIAIVAACVALYLGVGGYLTVIRTDIVQGLLLFAIAIGTYIMFDVPSLASIGGDIAGFGTNMQIGFFLLGLTFIYSAADHWQRLFSARDGATARAAFLLTIPYYTVIIAALIVFGIAMHAQYPDTPPGKLFYALFEKDDIQACLVAIVGLYSLTAAMSTLDTQTFLFGSTVMKVLGYSRAEDHGRFVRLLRAIMVALLIVMAVIASLIGDVVAFLVDAVTIFIVMAPVIFYVTVSKPVQHPLRDNALSAAVLTGFLLHGAMFFTSLMGQGILYNTIPVVGVALLVLCLAGFESFYRRR